MITLSELQLKEVILIETGKRLGHIYDLDIDPDIGRIRAIIVMPKDHKQGFFGKPEEVTIGWEQIATIGIDVILIRESNIYPLLEANTYDSL